MVWIPYVAGPNFRYIDSMGEECVCEFDGACGGNQSFEVLKCGGLHPVITEVLPVGGGVD